jgi:hypothetical protein
MGEYQRGRVITSLPAKKQQCGEHVAAGSFCSGLMVGLTHRPLVTACCPLAGPTDCDRCNLRLSVRDRRRIRLVSRPRKGVRAGQAGT